MTGRQASRIAVVVAIYSGCGGANPATAPTEPSPTPTSTQTILATRAIPPNNLVAPIDPTAISLEGAPINPFGIVRSALDQGPVGHPGIDLPSAAGTPVLAVAAGRIVTVGQAEPHHLAGQEVRLLIGEGPEAGTGWVFLYTHVALAAGIRIGTEVAAGRPFANSPLSPSDGNHFELAWAFNDFRFHQDLTCWVHQLNGAEQTSFEEHFNTVLRTDPRFIDGWMNMTFEGRFPFRALLDTQLFPEGAQLCYSPGTDVRK